MPDRIFASYSHKDQKYFDAFHKHLRIALGGDEHLEIWADTDIEASEDWDREIRTTLEQIGVAVLLVSTDFLDSEYIRELELPLLLRRRLEKKLILTPLFVRPSVADGWEFPVHIPGQDEIREVRITQFQGLNDPKNPLSQLSESDRELVLLHAARTVRDLALRPHHLDSRNNHGLPLAELGWSDEETLETRMRLRTFEEDWDIPGMEAYDEL